MRMPQMSGICVIHIKAEPLIHDLKDKYVNISLCLTNSSQTNQNNIVNGKNMFKCALSD